MALLSRIRGLRPGPSRRLHWALAAAFLLAGAASLRAQPPGRGRVAEAVVSGAIDPGSGEYIQSAIARAQNDGYEALILRLDTPGGLVTTTREIVQKMLDASIPVIVYVAPSAARAGSAGVFITLAGHVAAMAPTTNIGAAHPVSLFGGSGQKDKEGKEGGRSQEEIMAEKMVSDLSAFIEAIARDRGRNVEWAISAVRESSSISAEKAVELKVVDLIAQDRADLLDKVHGRVVRLGPGRAEHTLQTRDAPVDELPWALRHRFLHVIGDPTLASILLSLGGLALLLELYNPGTMVAGILGVILLLLGIIGVAALPVNVGAAALLAVGLALFVAEIFVSSYGLLGLVGALCFAAGGVLLIDNTGEDFFADADFGVSPRVFLPTAALVAAAAIYVGYKALAAWKLKPMVGEHSLLGEVGTADSDLLPEATGRVFIAGELWNAVSDQSLPRGARVRVVAVSGLTLRVTAA